jgi:hypothetical protein
MPDYNQGVTLEHRIWIYVTYLCLHYAMYKHIIIHRQSVYIYVLCTRQNQKIKWIY